MPIRIARYAYMESEPTQVPIPTLIERLREASALDTGIYVVKDGSRVEYVFVDGVMFVKGKGE